MCIRDRCSTIEVKINYFKPVLEGVVDCRSQVVHRGRTVAKSAEGIEGANIAISGGIVSITASDDGVNVSGGTSGQTQGGGGGGGMQDDGSLLGISGGTVIVNSSGDGLDSNGSTEITGGLIVV